MSRKDLSGNIIIGSSTVRLGSQITIAGHTISAGYSNVIIDTKTYAVPTAVGPIMSTLTSPQLTLPNGLVLIPGATAIAVSGGVISVLSDNKGFVVDGSTITLPPPTFTSFEQSIFTAGGQVFTAKPTGFAIAGISVALDGPPVIISGTVISLGTAGLVIGSKTVALPSVVAEATGLGDVIMSAFGSPSGEVRTPTPTPPPTGSSGNATTFIPISGVARGRSVMKGWTVMVVGFLVGIVRVV
ncbi:MAG: hypothetical protein Q9166_008042 [cf. Caloplaca sp. 2 TL-2023]